MFLKDVYNTHKKLLDNKVELSQLVNQDLPLAEKIDEMIMIPNNGVRIENKIAGEEIHAFDYTQAFAHGNMYKSHT